MLSDRGIRLSSEREREECVDWRVQRGKRGRALLARTKERPTEMEETLPVESRRAPLRKSGPRYFQGAAGIRARKKGHPRLPSLSPPGPLTTRIAVGAAIIRIRSK